MNGADWLLDALATEGITYLFGNPGSTELPLIEALGRQDRITYVLCLHEAAALGMADGYAQATGEIAAVNVHVQPGMANALSGILNARRARVPMVVTVGQQVTDLLPYAPFLGGEILGLAEPLAKSGWEPTTPEELERDFCFAIQKAREAPMGPTVLSLPLDLQVAPAPRHHQPVPATVATRDDGAASEALRLIRDAKRPAILAGDGVVHARASSQLVRLAEYLDAPVFGEPYAARAPLPTDTPSWRGPLPGFAAQIRQILKDYDLLIALGMPVFRLFGTSPGVALSADQRLIHVDVDPAEIGRSHAADLGVPADPGMFLDAILERLPQPGARVLAADAVVSHEGRGDTTISPSVLCSAIAEIVGPDDIVVDEALTAGRGLRNALVPRTPDNWFAHRGSALGWGLPAGVGIALAKPDQRVLVVHGDGSALFGLSALWTAAHLRRGLAVVIADNRGYEILRAGMEGLTGDAEGPWPGLQLTDPPVDLGQLCAGYGASIERATTVDELRDGLGRLWDRAIDGPAVLIASVSGRTPPVGYPIPT